MLEYKEGWQLAKFSIRMLDNGEERIVKVVNPAWWQDMEEKVEHLTIISIDKIVVTEEQKARYANVKNMPEDFGDIYSQYVEFGTIADHAHLLVSHPFVKLVTTLTERKNYEEINNLKKEAVDMKKSVVELFEMVLGGETIG